MTHVVSLALDSTERMHLLRALLWALLAWSEDARAGSGRKIEEYFAECDRLEGAIVDVLRDTGPVGIPMTTSSARCLRAVADACAEADTAVVSELAVIVHEIARRTHALFELTPS